MTDIIEAATDTPITGQGVAAGRRHGLTEHVVVESDSPVFDPPLDPGLETDKLNGFVAVQVDRPAEDSYAIKFDGGEAFVGGMYIARDESTNVTGEFPTDANGDYVPVPLGMGWTGTGNGGVSATNAFVIQPIVDFGQNDAFVPLATVAPSGLTSSSVSGPDIAVRPDAARAPHFTPSAAYERNVLTPPRDLLFDITGTTVDFATTVSNVIGDDKVFRLKPTILESNVEHQMNGQLSVNGIAVFNDDAVVNGTVGLNDNRIQFSGKTTDPPSSKRGEGTMWYRSDLSEFRVETANGTEKLDTTSV